MREDGDGKFIGGIEFAAGPCEHRLQSIVNADITVPVEFPAPLATSDRIEELRAEVMLAATVAAPSESEATLQARAKA